MTRRALSIGRVLLFVVLVGAAVCIAPVVFADGQEIQSSVLGWQTETVDDGGIVGLYTSLAVDSAGQPHISYYDDQAAELKYAHGQPSAWQIETVDSANRWCSSLALDSLDRPHVSYCSGDRLEYAYHDGTTWISETVDINSGWWWEYTSLALDSAGRPHISYVDGYQGGLWYAYHDGTQWQPELVDGGLVGRYNSLALDSADRPHISYYDSGAESLKYAYHDGSQWQPETVDQPHVGKYTSLGLDSADRPHISYYDANAGSLKYAYHDGSQWHPEPVDQLAVGQYTSLALDSADHPHISYYEAAYVPLGDGLLSPSYDLKYAYYDGSAWQIEYVDNTGDVGKWNSLALDGNDQPHISYYDDDADHLKYASDVPLSAYRRAAQLLEEMRGTDMAPGWEMAQLSREVNPLYRPDIQRVAYYEFPVVVPGTVGTEAAGFIIVATDDHDFTTPHWNFEGNSPTHELRAQAESQGYEVAKYYKLDALAYAAENAAGIQVGTLGEQPLRISGMDPAWVDDPPPSVETTWVPDQQVADDADASEISGTLVISGPTELPAIQLTAWGDWAELKAGYDDSYGVLAEALHREASEEWQLLSQIARDGEDLWKGDVYLLAMLWPSPTVVLSGTGAAYVQGDLLDRVGLPPLYQITVVDSVPGQALPLAVMVDYPNGQTEQVNFRVVELFRVWLPLVLRDSSGATSLLAQGPRQIESTQGWTSWKYYWAGTHNNQRKYGQIPKGVPPNTSSCVSGCGATAWAMLFGWADKQAALGNAMWAHRWGLYRKDGGYGENAVAPREQYSGVDNMTWEIRQRIKTWCAFGSGATFPWKMDNASGYLAGRTGASLDTHYSSVGIPWPSYRNKASSSIKDRDTPAVIGTGWLQHYPLAYGYKYRKYRVWGVTWYTQRRFYVNQGWYGDDNGWVSANTWFVGRLFP